MDANETRVVTIIMMSVGYNDFISMNYYCSKLAICATMDVFRFPSKQSQVLYAKWLAWIV